MPQSIRESRTSTSTKKFSDGYELVYDVHTKGFRMFNWNTAQGTVSKRDIQFSFDNV